MTTKKTKAGTIVQVRQPLDLVKAAYAGYSQIELQYEKAVLSEIIRENLKSNLPVYQRRLDVVNSLLIEAA